MKTDDEVLSDAIMIIDADEDETINSQFTLPKAESATVSIINTIKPYKERKKIMNRTEFYKILPKIPRIKKCDHRRTYGHALFSTLNSGDWSMLWNFMATYSASNFQSVYSYRVADNTRVMAVPPILVINNAEGVLEYAFL